MASAVATKVNETVIISPCPSPGPSISIIANVSASVPLPHKHTYPPPQKSENSTLNASQSAPPIKLEDWIHRAIASSNSCLWELYWANKSTRGMGLLRRCISVRDL